MLQQTLRTKVHLLQAPRISIVTSYARLFQSSQIRAFRLSTRLNTNEFTNVSATKINKVEADVDGLKGDIKTPEYSMKAQLAKYALKQARQTSQLHLHICGVMGVTILSIGGLWFLSIMESKRLDAEIERSRRVLLGVYESLNGE